MPYSRGVNYIRGPLRGEGTDQETESDLIIMTNHVTHVRETLDHLRVELHMVSGDVLELHFDNTAQLNGWLEQLLKRLP